MTPAFFALYNLLIIRVEISVFFVVINVSFPEYVAESTIYCEATSSGSVPSFKAFNAFLAVALFSH